MSASTSATHRRHWDALYDAKGARQVSWFQAEPVVSLALIDDLRLDPIEPVIDVGGGASMLVDRLLERGHTDVTVLDVSAQALRLAQRRLADQADRVHWEAADLLQWTPQRRFVLWHDRAVFHFLVDPADRAGYGAALRTGTAPGGLAVLGTFATDGPTRCSGLPVARYDPDRLRAAVAEASGEDWQLLRSAREEHHTPAGGVQPFTWVLLQRSA